MISYKKLRVLLAERGISNKDFKAMCSLTAKTTKKLLKDDDYVDLQTLEKIGITLQVNIGDILDIIDGDNLTI